MSTTDETARFHGRYVTFAGRTMLRVAGGEIDATQEEAAPVTESAAPGETEAPAGPPEGYVEQSRYDNLRAEQNRKQALWDRAQQGDLDAMRELRLPVQFEDETEPEEEDTAFRDPRLDQLLQEREQERAQRQQEEGWNRFNSDLDQVAKGKTLSDDDRLVIYTKTLQAGSSPDALQTAYGNFAKERAAYDQKVIDAYLESKRAPHVSPGGTGATQTPFREDMSLDERIAAAQEQARIISGM